MAAVAKLDYGATDASGDRQGWSHCRRSVFWRAGCHAPTSVIFDRIVLTTDLCLR